MNNSHRSRRLSARLSPKAQPRKNSSRRRYQWILILFVVCLGLVFAQGGSDFLFRRANAEAGPAQDPKSEISANVQKQIQTLAAMKQSLSPAQQKIDSQLIYATKQETGEMAALGLDSLQVDVKKNDDGKVLVDITADVTDAFLSLLQAHGGEIVSALPNYRSVRAEVALSQLENIAGFEGVWFIQPAQQAMTAQKGPRHPSPNPKASRTPEIRKRSPGT